MNWNGVLLVGAGGGEDCGCCEAQYCLALRKAEGCSCEELEVELEESSGSDCGSDTDGCSGAAVESSGAGSFASVPAWSVLAVESLGFADYFRTCLLDGIFLVWLNGGGIMMLLGGRRSGGLVGSLPGSQAWGVGVGRRKRLLGGRGICSWYGLVWVYLFTLGVGRAGLVSVD